MTARRSRSLVTVVVPAFNAARFVGRAIESALAQTHRALEVLVVDDGSTDETAAIVELIARRDTRVALLQQENRGAAEARNLGIHHANGEFVAMLDHDDLWHPTKIERQLARFDGSSNVLGVVYCWFCLVDEDDRITGGARASSQWSPEGRVLAALAYRNFLGNGSTPLIRRACFERVGYYDPSVSGRRAGNEDHDMYLRLAEEYEFAVVPEFLVGWRQHEGSISNDPARMRRSHAFVLDKTYRRNPGLPRSIRRWSTASFFAFLAWKQYRQGKPGRATTWALRAALLDPILLLSPETRRGARRLIGASDAPTDNNATSTLFGSAPVRPADAPDATTTSGLYEHLVQHRWNKLATISNDMTAREQFTGSA